jgi:hypothetical protein
MAVSDQEIQRELDNLRWGRKLKTSSPLRWSLTIYMTEQVIPAIIRIVTGSWRYPA